jgi:tape measure domain-containing protein
MATITGQLKLNDGMSSVMRGITSTMRVLVGSFYEMQSASKQAVDPGAFEQMHTALDTVEADLANVNDQLIGVQAGSDAVGTSMRTAASGGGDALLKKVMSVGAVVGAWRGVQKLLDFSDAMTQTRSRLDLMNDGLQTTDQLQEKIMASANRARASYQTTADVVSKLGMQAGSAFRSNDEIVAFAEQLNKSFTVAGTSQTGIDSVMYNLTQALSLGILRGQDLNAVFSNAPNILQNVADYLNVPIGKIREMGADGELSAQVIKNAMFAAADATNAKFGQMPMTFGQMFTAIQNKSVSMLLPIQKALSEAFNNGSIERVMQSVSKFLGTIASMAQFVISHWNGISAVLESVVAIIGIYTTTILIAKAATFAHAVITGIAAIAHADGAAAKAAETAAQLGLNAAMMASPVTWIIMGIIALIAVIYIVINAVHKATGSTHSALGSIMGAIFVAGAAIWNTVIGLINGIIEFVWARFVTPVATVINWVVNAFGGGFDSIGGAFKNLLGNMISMFIGFAKPFTKIWDTITGSDTTASIDALQSQFKDWGKGANYQEVISTQAPTIDARWDYTDAYGSGAKVGDGLNDKLKSLGAGYDPTSGLDEFDYLDQIAASTADTASNTKQTKEDLAYMRDLAEMEVVNRFTAAEIKVDMSGMSNTVNNGMDLDGVIDVMVEGIAEAVNVGAEGVHA